MKNKLTPKQERFIEEYLIDLNATQAAIRAGYSEKTAGWIGQQLLVKTHIFEEISRRKKVASNSLQITYERILKEMARLAFVDSRNFFHKDGTPIPINELSDDAAATLVGFDVVTVGNSELGFGQVMKYKIPDKNKALENLARILGYFEKDNNQKKAVMSIDLDRFFNDVLKKPGSGDAT